MNEKYSKLAHNRSIIQLYTLFLWKKKYFFFFFQKLGTIGTIAKN